MNVKNIFFLRNDMTVFVVNKDEYIAYALQNRTWKVYVNGDFYQNVPDLKESLLLKQSKNLDEVPLQTTAKLDNLKNIDLELNKVELKYMKTFDEYFIQFKKEYSFENLYFKDIFSKKSNRWLFSFVIFLIFSSCAGIFLLLYYYQYAYVAYSLTIIPSVSILVYIYLITPYKIRQKLKSKNLPILLNIFRWKSDELINLRIVEIYKGYYQENETTINKLIDIYQLN